MFGYQSQEKKKLLKKQAFDIKTNLFNILPTFLNFRE